MSVNEIHKQSESAFEVYFISNSNRHISSEPILVTECQKDASQYVIMKDYINYEHPASGERINLSKGEKISINQTVRYKNA
jgi:cysteine sulfinate desulfinase/cysteine desulfurase-like protein